MYYRQPRKRNNKSRKSFSGGAGNGDVQEGFSGAPFLIEQTKVVTLAYTDSTLIRNNAGNKYLFFRLRANGLYDPDPLLLTGNVSGFSEYSNFFRRYLVTSVSLDWQVTNLEAFPITLVTTASTFDIASVITTPALVLDQAENPFFVERKLSQAGGMDRARLVKTVRLDKLHGDPKTYMGSMTYSGLGLSNPTNLLFLNFMVASNSNLVNGIDSTLRIRFKVKWFERQSIDDRLLRIKSPKDVTVPVTSCGTWHKTGCYEYDSDCCSCDR